MPDSGTAYLVVQRDDGFGDVYPLKADQRVTLGRSPSNVIVVPDDLCSREHAEVFSSEGNWCLVDLESLNGTRVNGQPISGTVKLSPRDEIRLGRSRFLFVEDMGQLPEIAPPAEQEGELITKRLEQTRFLTPVNLEQVETPTGMGTPPLARHNLSQDLALLYRLALDMGSAGSSQELREVVLKGLLDATPADVVAILAMGEKETLEVAAYRRRRPSSSPYKRVSDYLSREVRSSGKAVLAKNVARDRYLRNRESLAELGATSVICTPVRFQDQLLGLIHLYCADPLKTLDEEDLEFAMAVAMQLGNAIHHLQEQESLRDVNRNLRDQLQVESELVGESPAIQNILSQIDRVARTNATVLIRGESGVGKELVARAIHNSSPRRDRAFICLNCAALTETLLESELFGHEKGAFTGATEKKIGKFEAADRGTIFLDEIGEMTVSTQAKLLRVLEGHSFERVGGNASIKVDVRVVAATNQPLEEAVRAGKFRRDLFFRLNVVDILVPPLRDRPGDIPILAKHFLSRFVWETGRKIQAFSPGAMQKMEGYHWPGNVRELRNVVERAVALGNGPQLEAADIWLSSLEAPRPADQDAFQPLSLDALEKIHILRTLNHTDWNKSRTAEILNIERSTLDRKIKLYELKR